MIPSTIDYANRQVDVELLQSITVPAPEQSVVLGNVGHVPKIVTGIEKAVQRYASLVLTTSNDVHFDQTLGSQLVADVMAGRVADKGYLNHLFSLANKSALTALRADDDATEVFGPIQDDEFIVSAKLQDIVLDYINHTIGLTVMITTRAGTTYTYVVPITTGR